MKAVLRRGVGIGYANVDNAGIQGKRGYHLSFVTICAIYCLLAL